MNKLKIGQIFTIENEYAVEYDLSGKEEIIKSNEEIVIGADRFAHYLSNGFIQPLSPKDIIEGYDTEGIAKVIYKSLSNTYYIDDFLTYHDRDTSEFIDEIADALDRYLGM